MRGGSVLASKMWTGLIWCRGDPIGAGTLGLRYWEGTIWSGTRGGSFELKTKNRAVGAWFWLAKCVQASLEVEGTLLERGMLRLRWREGAIGSSARGGLLGLQNQKPSCGGSVLVNEM